jgi:hypothetical protein
VRITGFGLFAAGFLCLLAAAAGVLLAQFRQSLLASLISVGYSGAAVVFVLAAIALRRR